MKKPWIIGVCIVAAVLVSMPLATAKSTPKTTGYAGMTLYPDEDKWAYVDFAAFDYGKAYEDWGELYFELWIMEDEEWVMDGYFWLEIVSVRVDKTNMMAFCAGNITESTITGWGVGDWVEVAVHDGGEPSWEKDNAYMAKAGHWKAGETASLAWVDSVKPADLKDKWLPVEEGNIQVHAK